MHSPLLIHVDMVTKSIEDSIDYYSTYFKYKVVEDCIVSGKAALFLSNNTADRMRLVFLKLNSRSPMIELIQFIDSNGEYIDKIDYRLQLNVSLSYLVSDISETINIMKNQGLNPASEIYDISLEKLGKAQIVYFRDPIII